MKTSQSHFGEMPPRYNFVLNPYPDMSVSSCPFCGQKTGQRKLPLLIHIVPINLIALNYTCCYCQACDLLIAHKHEIEHLLTGLFSQANPDMVGNEYLVMGTVEKRAWREGLQKPKSVAEMLPYASDFASYYKELRARGTGWYPTGQEPRIMEPPVSQEWVKSTR